MPRILPTAALALLISSIAFAESDAKRPEPPSGEKRRFAFRFAGARLGVEALEISKDVRHLLGAPDDVGVLVNRVQPDTSAAEAGIKAGDVVVEIDGHRVTDVHDIREALAAKRQGEKAQVVVIRDKSRKSLVATITEKAWNHPMPPFAFDDGIFAEGFGPDLQRQLQKLNERVAELEKKLQKLDSK